MNEQGRFSSVVGLNSIQSLLRVSDFEFNVSPTLGNEWVCVCAYVSVCVCVCFLKFSAARTSMKWVKS